jgi:UDP-N-acetylmuramoyl-L-alanyl-D-glutamate--2,6-diaminopimelate ligase
MHKVCLKYLLSPWIRNIPKKDIFHLSMDSRTVVPGTLFIAIIGTKQDGRNFIYEAIHKKATIILYEIHKKLDHGKCKYINYVPIICFFKLNEYISLLADRFYNTPGKKIKIIGVTGTNGKTTVTQVINQWANILGHKVATIGTLGNGFYGFLKPTKNTTPSAIYIQSFLYMALKKKTELVTMEVSSHGLVQHRVKGVHFYIGIFTNLSQDHLDYHKNMKQYEASKWLLFSTHIVKKIIINANDDHGKIWLKKLFNFYTVAVTIQDNTQKKYSKKWINATNIQYYKETVQITFESSWGNAKISSSLIGRFNVINLLLSLACLLELGYSFLDLLKTSNKIKPIQGRMETFQYHSQTKFIIDYAHTPDALKQALTAIRLQYNQKYIWCIFGCGGERDKTKRSIMGSIAESIADKIIITNDNPRNEKERNIVVNILNGIKNKKKILIILNRKKAISYAFFKSKSNDIIFISGKGHEEQQIIKNRRINYSDKTTVLKLLGKDI